MDARSVASVKPVPGTRRQEACSKTAEPLQGIEKFESDLWKIADNLRANSNLASNEYFMPIMGLIFLRHATNRFDEAQAAIEADKAAGKMPERPLVEADFTRRRALMLPEAARFDVDPEDAARTATSARRSPRRWRRSRPRFQPLAGQLPKDYEHLRGRASSKTCCACSISEGLAQRLGRRVRPHLRILPRRVLHAGRARQRRVLHAALDRADHRQRHRAGPRHRLRPGLRLGRHVRAVQPLHRARGPGHDEACHLLRPGEERDDQPARQDEPRRARAGRHDRPARPSPTTRTRTNSSASATS